MPGRRSSDNIIINKEVIHSMCNMRGNRSFMAIKVDLEKAYDRLNWHFVINCLRELNLPDNRIRIIFIYINIILI